MIRDTLSFTKDGSGNGKSPESQETGVRICRRMVHLEATWSSIGEYGRVQTTNLEGFTEFVSQDEKIIPSRDLIRIYLYIESTLSLHSTNAVHRDPTRHNQR